ncbi:GTPase domain-containing protein [Methylobacter sp. BlB1]|uniref:GTPase domain-containing protein n=1 Tax=Methylobacter sp. BlB1 TaxID=2785914 RepID=UPI001893ECB1|nr:GTPase [Methylobacter sp. BlB1]MBF6649249.1 50S ribosome-binding GTPase [Methylobacter sp. BlB1]
MLEFIQLLKQRYQAVLSQPGNESAKTSYQQRIDQLLLAEAFMRKGQLIASTPEYPLQITVIGPTQAGKSSLVNLLLNSNVAGVSPLAGYTVHPEGFCNDISPKDCSDLQRYFGRFQQLQQAHARTDRYDCYLLTENTTVSKYLPPSVLWDTPDFDSIDAANYREGLIRTIALADMIILAVSKEKYADQSVWDIMAVLEDLHQPTVICLNKLVEGSESLLIHSLKEKWRHARNDEFPEVVPLYYQKQTGMPVWPESRQNLLIQMAHKVNHKKQARYEQELLQKNWQYWVEPVVAEHQALKDWQELIDQLIKQALESYQRDYLNHPHHYETFKYALAQLLNLLEIPGLAGVLSGTRRVLTWPIRQIMKLGRKRQHIADSSHEVALLKQIAEHMLIQMADRLLDRAEQNRQNPWWKEASSLLRSQRSDILQDFSEAARRYHIAFQQEVENTAQQLYHKLQEKPVLLNSLRATRVTTDAAAIALALNTGGIGMHDLIIAPAMLTVTSLLAESAIGNYVHRVEAELKQHQLNTVKQSLFIDGMGSKLSALPKQLTHLTQFNIAPEQLQAAEHQLKEKRHGLRLL